MLALFRHRLLVVLYVFSLLVLGGTTGFVLIEGWGWSDALFMTVTTLSTVGYGEVQPLSDRGRLFSMTLIVLGVGGAAYTFGLLTDYIIAGELRGVLRRQRIMRNIAQLQGHFIICGYGRVGRQVVEGLRADSVELVVIDTGFEDDEEVRNRGIYFLKGSATEDEVLLRAGIKRAAGFCSCLPTDADNVFAVLTARTLNPKLTIIARSNTQESERKLHMAGADHVINPYLITGHRMAAQLLHPGAVEFLDVMMRQGEAELRVEEVQVAAASPLAGRTLGDSHVRHTTGVNVLAVRRNSGEVVTSLTASFCIAAGDILVGLGTAAQLAELAKQAGDARRGQRPPARAAF